MLRSALALYLVAAATIAGASDEPPEKTTWKEKAVLETPAALPGSVAYSSDGTTMVVGCTAGKVFAFNAAAGTPIWTAEVGGRFAAVAYTSDGKSIVATFDDGGRFLNAPTGALGDSIEAKGSRPVAVGVFPDREIAAGDQKLLSHKVIFANARGCVVKTWIGSGSPGTIQLSTTAKDKTPADPNAVPLAIDPAGRSVIVAGPIHPETGKNVLWAWVAGNYEKGSPGNRLLEGHQAAVVSAAWSRDGKTAATGDSDGRVILWDATAMKETHRLELGGRVAALALSSRGETIAAVVVGKKAEYYAWETADPKDPGKPIHVETADFSGPIQASLAFAPDGRQLAGCALNMVHVWQTDNPNRD